MRTTIAIILAASIAVSATPVAAQEANTAYTANTAAPAPAPETDANVDATVPPADGNAVTTTEVAPATDTMVTEEPTEPAPRPRDRSLPWGLLGLLGLVGLLGRRRSE